MKRREFLAMTAGAGLAVTPADAEPATPSSTTQEDSGTINEYFLESNELNEEEQTELENWTELQKRQSEGERLRGSSRPKKASTYLFVHWPHPLGTDGQFVFPLDLPPSPTPMRACRVNAQVMNFQTHSAVWDDKEEQGTLRVDFQGQSPAGPGQSAKAETTGYLRPFDVIRGEEANFDMDWVCHNEDKTPEDLVTVDPVRIRFQLMRFRQKGSFWGKVFTIASKGLAGLGPAGMALSYLPSLSIPRMTPEATKFVDGVFGSVADDKREPVWKGYFTAFKIGGDRGYRVTPGYWVAMDERPEALSQLRLESHVGRPTLVRNGQPADMNYVVLDLMLEEVAES